MKSDYTSPLSRTLAMREGISDRNNAVAAATAATDNDDNDHDDTDESGDEALNDNAALAANGTLAAPPRFVTEFHPSDVFAGRGGPMAGSQGNMDYRDLIKARRLEFCTAKRRHNKSAIARDILNNIYRRDGRFLRKLETAEQAIELGIPDGQDPWIVMTDDEAIIKIKQSLRHKDRNRSSSAKSSREKKKQKGNTTAASLPPLAAARKGVLEPLDTPPQQPPPLETNAVNVPNAHVAGADTDIGRSAAVDNSNSVEILHPLVGPPVTTPAISQPQLAPHGALIPNASIASVNGAAGPLAVSGGGDDGATTAALLQIWNRQQAMIEAATAATSNPQHTALAMAGANGTLHNPFVQSSPNMQILQAIQEQDLQLYHQEQQYATDIAIMEQRRLQVQLQRRTLQTQAASLMLTMSQVASQVPPPSQSYMNSFPNAAGAAAAAAAASAASTALTHRGPSVWGSSMPFAGHTQPNTVQLYSTPLGLHHHQHQQPPSIVANDSAMVPTSVSTNDSSSDQSHSLQPNVAAPPVGNSNHGGTSGIIAVLAAAAAQAAATETEADSRLATRVDRRILTGEDCPVDDGTRRRSSLSSSNDSQDSGHKKPRATHV